MPRARARRSMSGVRASGDTLQRQGLVRTHFHRSRRQLRAGQYADRMRGVEYHFPAIAIAGRRKLELAFRLGGIEQQQPLGCRRGAAEPYAEASLLRIVPLTVGHLVTVRMPPADVTRMAGVQRTLEKGVAT